MARYTLWVRGKDGTEAQVTSDDVIHYAPGGFWTHEITGNDMDEMLGAIAESVMERTREEAIREVRHVLRTSPVYGYSADFTTTDLATRIVEALNG